MNNLKLDVLKASKIYFGLSPITFRKLAYEFSVANNIKHPPSWDANKAAGPDWFSGFIRRNKNLSNHKPEASSLSRSTNFNRTNVGLFFDYLSEVLEKHHFNACEIYNVDETGVTTVQRPDSIVAEKGVKQVGAITSWERGKLVMVTVAGSVNGNTIQPFFVFPRARFHDHFLAHGPTGAVGSANSSGWMQSEDFLMSMQHFVIHKVFKNFACLLILDNHPSHLSIELINYCREKGVVLLTLPPHCSHKMQPLDRTVFGPFKKYVNSACDNWMKNHLGKSISIYDIPHIIKLALPSAATPVNSQNDFKVSGISPFNSNIFTEDNNMASYVTDREYLRDEPSSSAALIPPDIPSTSFEDPSRVNLSVTTLPDGVTKSPQIVLPFPIAQPRLKKLSSRKRRFAVVTSTPEKEKLEEAQRAKPKPGYKKVKRNLLKAKTSSKKQEWFCVGADDSAPGEVWVQRSKCKG